MNNRNNFPPKRGELRLWWTRYKGVKLICLMSSKSSVFRFCRRHNKKRENEAEWMFLAITTFRRCHSIFLKWKSRESISHVSLGGPSHLPKHFRITWRSDFHIHRLDWASRTVTNSQGLKISPSEVAFFCSYDTDSHLTVFQPNLSSWRLSVKISFHLLI